MYEPSKQIDSFNVSGFQYWDGALVLSQMKPGDALAMHAERDNPHDPEAIALFFGTTKIGYVPADRNALLSAMLFYGHGSAFEARILQVSPEADPWKQVRVGIYISDAR